MMVKGMQLAIRLILFVLILIAGTASALVVGESTGTAMANLSDVSVQAVARALADHALYAALTGGNQPTGIYRSTDNGITWQLVSSGPGAVINALAVHPVHPEWLYAGTTGGALEVASSLWYSNDGGVTWRRFELGLPASPYGMVPAVTALAVDRAHPEILYVGTDGQGVYRFNVERNHYEMVGGLSLYNAYVRSLVIASDGKIYAVTNEGAFVSDGEVWHRLDALPELPVSLAVASGNPQVLYAGGSSIGISRSTDGGQSWQMVNDGIMVTPGAALRVTALEVNENDANHVVAATAWGLGGHLVGGTLYESRSGGLNWVKVTDVRGIVNRITFNQGVLYAATANGLVRLGGETAQPVQVSLLSDWTKLRNPTGVQILMLILTLALASLVLAWRREWFMRREPCSAC